MPLKIEETAKYTLHERITPGGPVVKPWEMADGDIGVIAHGINNPYTSDAVVLRVYNQLIAINRLRVNWPVSGNSPNFNVRLLKPTDAITIIMK